MKRFAWQPLQVGDRQVRLRTCGEQAAPGAVYLCPSVGEYPIYDEAIYQVMLAEATREVGGRVLGEARLPGLAAWIRVVDYRKGQLAQLPNVELALESEVTADEVLAYGFQHVAVATSSRSGPTSG